MGPGGASPRETKHRTLTLFIHSVKAARQVLQQTQNHHATQQPCFWVYTPKKCTTETLWERSVAIGASLLTRVAAQLLEGRLPAVPQDETKATYAAKMSREDGFIDWTWSAKMIHDHIRACNPWPGAVTWRKGKEIKLWKSEWPVPDPGPLGIPGEITVAKKELFVSARDGFIKITELQPAGGARQTAEAFVAGLRGEKVFLENKPEGI